MSRIRDIIYVTEELRKNPPVTEEGIETAKLAVLAQIAVSLAVIADKMTEEVTE